MILKLSFYLGHQAYGLNCSLHITWGVETPAFLDKFSNAPSPVSSWSYTFSSNIFHAIKNENCGTLIKEYI